jgi:iron complex outermembrane receptor protein
VLFNVLRGRLCGRVIAVCAVSLVSLPAFAQRADENAVKSAQDAFGTTVGNETIGLYSSLSARGFNPTQAGNIRIEGLYFDEQTNTSGLLNHVFSGSTIHVGLSAQSYPFPAPTGIANYLLRTPGDKQVTSVFAGYGPYDGITGEIDSQIPLVEGKLSAGVGVTYRHQGYDWGSHSDMWTASALLRWRPTDDIEIIPFWGKSELSDWEVLPITFTGGPYTPPKYPRLTFTTQDWADWEENVDVWGAVARANLGTGLGGSWTLRSGLFRSLSFRPEDSLVFFTNTQQNGAANLSFQGNPPQRFGSYSGEVRLSGVFVEGQRRHTVHLLARGRDASRLFGGASTVNFGPTTFGVEMKVPKPNFVFGPRTSSTTQQGTTGLAYEALWTGVGELSAGLQKTFYGRDIRQPGLPQTRSTSNPWLYNATLAVYATPELAVYTSYTRGLEESGVAPERAVNRGDSTPASLTEQIDAGIRYAITPRLKLVAGVFEIKKPYFDTDLTGFFTRVGGVRHRGVELSLAGQVTDGLTIVAGSIFLQARLSGVLVDQGVVGPIPVGRRPRVTRLNVQYGPASWNGFSVETQVENNKLGYGNSANTLKLSPFTVLNAGMRYRFKAFDVPATFRAQVLNVTNTYGWSVSGGSQYFTFQGPRRVALSLAADF